MDILPIFVGFDQREAEAADVCSKSIRRRTSEAVHIRMLDERALRYIGIYDRPWRIEDGQKIDERDGKPFSTEFAFSRFLVPPLSLYDGWALFCDGDFLFTADVAGLFALRDESKAVQVVKHDHVPHETTKMDGQRQEKYHRKNWSSLILWNCSHPSNRFLTVQAVNHEPGQWLHAFGWLRDDEIGELPATWNHLVGVSDETNDIPCGLHFTNGIPTMPGYENAPYAALWLKERDSRRIGNRPLPSERVKAIA